MFSDRAIGCLDCGTDFEFSAGEQEFYAQRGFTEAPKRCPSCRAARKAARAQTTASDNGQAGPPAYAAYGERRPREMFDSVCADCGGTASVPFKPSGIKPVYCRDCFQGHR